MINTICWNARSINTQGAHERMQNLKKIHNLAMIGILELFAGQQQIHSYGNKFLMDHANSIPNNKIWLFWTCHINRKVLDVDDQNITCVINDVQYA